MTSTTTSAPTTTTPTAIPSCTTAVPGKYGYVPPDACNAYYAYQPSYPGAIAFAALFGIMTVTHLILAIVFKKGFSWVLIMGCTWELISFIARALGAHDQQSLAYVYVTQLLFLLAPLWINAYVYMTAGRLIYTFHPAKAMLRIKAMSVGKYFVWLDIVSFLVQAIGGSMLNPGNDAKTIDLGKKVYMSGLGVQEAFIVFFTAMIVKFYVEIRAMERAGTVAIQARWKSLTFALFAVLAFITIRIIFRLVEFSAGVTQSNPLPTHEEYALCLDALPMLLAMIVLAVVHPGTVLRGPESEFPSRKERKAEKKARKAERKAAKEEKKAAKNKGINQNMV